MQFIDYKDQHCQQYNFNLKGLGFSMYGLPAFFSSVVVRLQSLIKKVLIIC